MSAILIAALFWLSDSAVHYFAYGEAELEFIPSDVNELWMRSLIVILVVSFGAFADYRKRIDNHDVYSAMLNATHHILRNFLQKMLLFREEAENSKDFDQNVLAAYDEMIRETTAQIRNLEDIREPSRENIEDRYRPR
ncbi:MAG: hypothetical protein HKN84_05500 [Gammaproteobacteria bacterium]|nr:hypothetical protein [Gammaproteobacteria bacterium]